MGRGLATCEILYLGEMEKLKDEGCVEFKE